MTDVSSSNGANGGAQAGDMSMAGTGGTGRKSGGTEGGGAATGAAESASFDEAPSVTQPSADTSGGQSDTSPSVSGQAGKLADEAQARLKATLTSIEARSQELRRWASAQQDTAREVIEDKPVAVVASAFGIGLVLGLLAARL